jgi:hypothetical protein
MTSPALPSQREGTRAGPRQAFPAEHPEAGLTHRQIARIAAASLWARGTADLVFPTRNVA